MRAGVSIQCPSARTTVNRGTLERQTVLSRGLHPSPPACRGGPYGFYGSGGPTAPAGLNYRKGGLWWRMKVLMGRARQHFTSEPLWFMGPLLFYGSSILYWSKKPGAIPRSPREWGKGGLNLALFYEHIICSIRFTYMLVGGV